MKATTKQIGLKKKRLYQSKDGLLKSDDYDDNNQLEENFFSCPKSEIYLTYRNWEHFFLLGAHTHTINQTVLDPV